MRARAGETKKLARNASLHAAKSGIGMCDAADAAAILKTASTEVCSFLGTLKSCLKKTADGAPPARRKRVTYAKACPDTQHERMVDVASRLPAARGVETKQSFSQILAEMAGRGAVPLGHGAKDEYKLDFDAFMGHLLDCRDGVCRDVVRRKLAACERRTDQVQLDLLRKSKSGTSWRGIDEWRPALLVPHASRAVANMEAKKALAQLCATMRCAGTQWAKDEDDAMEMRRVSVEWLRAEIEAKEQRADKLHTIFTTEFFQKMRESGNMPAPREAMKAANVAWNASDRNPKNKPQNAPSVGARAWRAAAVAAAENAQQATENAADDTPTADGAGDAVDAEAEIVAEDDGLEVVEAEDLPPIENTAQSREAWREAAVCFAQIGYYDAPTTDDDMDIDAPTQVRTAFLTEIGKDPTLPGGYGPLGLGMLRELAERARWRDARELHAISRESDATGAPFDATADARKQFEATGAKILRRHVCGDDPAHHDMEKHPEARAHTL